MGIALLNPSYVVLPNGFNDDLQATFSARKFNASASRAVIGLQGRRKEVEVT